MNLLLHTCCAPCSAAIIEYLLAEEIRPALYYFNPNIFPQTEYEIRKNECIRHARSLGLEIIDGDYRHDSWLKKIEGLENEPECGLRCAKCFEMRLKATAELASRKGFDTIATTLASSRWKNLKQISEAGNKAVASFPSIRFWDKNWRKDGLSIRRNILLKEYNFYNQQYCGCEFSMAKKKG
jgi:predicted adenine nucleotide alpha hydrolase (AANH) superfamily ATPase